jgi:hypothetical protein
MNTYIIIWKLKLFLIVSLFAIEVELILLNKVTCELMWIHNIIQSIFALNEIPPSTIHCNNNLVIAIAKSNYITDQNKHIKLKYFHIRHLVDKKFIVVTKIPTDWQVANIFTKAFVNLKFTKLCESLGVF